MSFRQNMKHRSQAVSWALAYALYLLMSIGVIVASVITEKYGNRFFGDINAPLPPGETEAGESGNLDTPRFQRDHALARTGIIGSVGIAAGSIALILIVLTFTAHQVLDYRSIERDPHAGYRSRQALLVVTCVINMILFGGDFALCAGFTLTANAIKHYASAEQSSAPSYLIGCAVMAALAGAAAGITIAIDASRYFSLLHTIRDRESEAEAVEQADVK